MKVGDRVRATNTRSGNTAEFTVVDITNNWVGSGEHTYVAAYGWEFTVLGLPQGTIVKFMFLGRNYAAVVDKDGDFLATDLETTETVIFLKNEIKEYTVL